MHSDQWMKMCFYATVSVAWLTAASTVLHGGTVEVNAQEAVAERIRDDVKVGPVMDVQRPRGAPEPPSYYQGDTAKTKQRGLDRRQVEQEQDRYYKEQSDNAKKRTGLMEREADEYYGPK